jgi:hypothetical protein
MAGNAGWGTEQQNFLHIMIKALVVVGAMWKNSGILAVL